MQLNSKESGEIINPFVYNLAQKKKKLLAHFGSNKRMKKI